MIELDRFHLLIFVHILRCGGTSVQTLVGFIQDSLVALDHLERPPSCLAHHSPLLKPQQSQCPDCTWPGDST